MSVYHASPAVFDLPVSDAPAPWSRMAEIRMRPLGRGPEEANTTTNKAYMYVRTHARTGHVRTSKETVRETKSAAP